MHNPISLYSNSNTKAPSHIDNHHYQEWLNSGVKEEIICKNIKSYHDPVEVDKLLNRNNKSRWKHSDNLVPCWAVSGVDPMTDESTLTGVQVKPDTPQNKEGKILKYLGASSYTPTPLFLDTGIKEYWKGIIDDKTEPVLLGEGAKKAGAALSIGHAMISIPGVSTCRKKGRLHPSLDLFAGFGRVFYLAFDNDVMSKKPVQTALLAMGRELSATGSKVMVVCLPPGELKGVDDFIAARGEEAFNDLVTSALTIEEWHEQIKETWREQLEEIKSNKRSKVARYMEIIKLGWGHELRYNELKTSIELSGQPLDLDQVRLRIALEFDLDVPIQDAQSIIENLAKENSYHPVTDYLDSLARQYPQPDLSILDNLASRYFGTDELLHNLYLRKTLIAAVARVKEPGCKHDEATILVGGQGIGKSTFWEKLFCSDWFTDELGDANEKDELMKLHRFWGLEWAEFETVYKRKDVSSLKKFMTTKIDPIRTPYARSLKEYPRQSVLVGSTNEQEILSDPTGSRRFWIVPVSKRIPTNQLEEERDKIWAAAYALYRSGEKWFLDWEDMALQEELNKDYQTQDPWGETIHNYIVHKSEVTLNDIFHQLSIEPAKQDMTATKRISSILRGFNWERVRKFVDGVWVRIWQEAKLKVGFLGGSRGIVKVEDTFDTSSQPEKNYRKLDLQGDLGGSSDKDVVLDTVYKKEKNYEDRDFSPAQQDLQGFKDFTIPLDPPPNQTFGNFDNATWGVGSNPSPAPTEILCPRTGLPLPKPFEIKVESPLGISTCLVTAQKVRKKDGRTESRFEFEFANGTASRKFASVAKKAEAEEFATKEINARILEALKHPSRRYSVYQIVGTMLEPEVIWVEGCTCTQTPEHPINSFYVFKTPSGDRIQVAGENEFKLETET
ncbi:MAG: VapE domain-containing protein [Hassallia sp.]